MSDCRSSLATELLAEQERVIKRDLEAFQCIKELLASGDVSEAFKICEIQIEKNNLERK